VISATGISFTEEKRLKVLKFPLNEKQKNLLQFIVFWQITFGIMCLIWLRWYILHGSLFHSKSTRARERLIGHRKP
jgi:type VI protein secretion system component VasF